VPGLAQTVGVRTACAALGLSRARYYRQRQPAAPARPRGGGPQPRALCAAERQAVLDVLHSERFRDAAPAEVYATFLEEGTYLCSQRTMYRLLAAAQEVRERRDQARHPVYTRPELLATRPNEVWSWDITKLRGPAKWTYFYLYVILDVFSRYVVGWLIGLRETAELAQDFIGETAAKQGIDPDRLTLHADRGTSMPSKSVAVLLSDLGITKSHSRPHVSNDNPYSESQFKTLKYRPDFPDEFASVEEARAYCQTFFPWYNREHHHSGIGLLTPEAMHYGLATARQLVRAATLDVAYAAHPERFVRQAPTPPAIPTAAWINQPATPKEEAPEVSQKILPSFPPKSVSTRLTTSAGAPRAVRQALVQPEPARPPPRPSGPRPAPPSAGPAAGAPVHRRRS
jgi:putative transposase